MTMEQANVFFILFMVVVGISAVFSIGEKAKSNRRQNRSLEIQEESLKQRYAQQQLAERKYDLDVEKNQQNERQVKARVHTSEEKMYGDWRKEVRDITSQKPSRENEISLTVALAKLVGAGEYSQSQMDLILDAYKSKLDSLENGNESVDAMDQRFQKNKKRK